jgi:stage V sporulation protein G
MEIISFRNLNIGKIRATLDIQTTEGFIIRGFKVVEGEKGLFVGMPSERTRTGKYLDLVRIEDPTLKEMLESLILDEYHRRQESEQ